MNTLKRLTLYLAIIILAFIPKLNASKFQPLDALVEQKFTDKTQVIRISNDEKLSIPLNGRYISYNIKYFPENANDCTFKEPNVQYKKLAESSKLFEQDDEVVATLVLKRQEKIILADPYYNIVIYSTDQHKLLRLLSPKTSLLSSNSKSGKEMVNSLAMITTEEQNYIYYLSPFASFVFSSKSFGTQIQKLNATFPSIQKALYYKSHIFILSAEEGIFVYKLNKTTHAIQKIQTLKNKKNHQFVDIEFDPMRQLFYVLTQSSIEVYLFEPSNFPNPEDQKQFIILHSQDEIDLTSHTRNHASEIFENNQHINLQIASNTASTELFVLFRHLRQNAIAQFDYDPNSKEVTFLRYFKFQMQIKEIHTIEDVIVVVGEDILGMFPYGIDPRLITEEFNGWMALSDIQKIIITEAPYFVGITKNSIQYGGLLFSQEVGLHCQFNESSLTKTISFSGNLTWCSKDEVHSYNEYCSFSKSFLVESMDIVTTSTVSSSVWIVIIVCTIAIIFGILIMLIMHKKKQQEIKKLENYFEDRRRTQIPASSDRRDTDHKM